MEIEETKHCRGVEQRTGFAIKESSFSSRNTDEQSGLHVGVRVFLFKPFDSKPVKLFSKVNKFSDTFILCYYFFMNNMNNLRCDQTEVSAKQASPFKTLITS